MIFASRSDKGDPKDGKPAIPPLPVAPPLPGTAPADQPDIAAEVSAPPTPAVPPPAAPLPLSPPAQAKPTAPLPAPTADAVVGDTPPEAIDPIATPAQASSPPSASIRAEPVFEPATTAPTPVIAAQTPEPVVQPSVPPVAVPAPAPTVAVAPPPPPMPPHPAPSAAPAVPAYAPAPPPVSPGVAASVVVALLDELAAVAAGPQGHAFLTALGHRIALRHPLGTPANLIEMEQQANAVWQLLGWGRTRLLASVAGIRIMHHDWPQQLAGDDGQLWHAALPVLLAGVYHGWFTAMGGPDDLATTVSALNAKAIELHHGRAHVEVTHPAV